MCAPASIHLRLHGAAGVLVAAALAQRASSWRTQSRPAALVGETRCTWVMRLPSGLTRGQVDVGAFVEEQLGAGAVACS